MSSNIARSVRATLFLLAVSTLAVSNAVAQEGIAGDWEGTVEAGGQVVDFVFHVTVGEDGELSVLMDVPAQGTFGVPVDDPAFEDGVLTFGFSAAPGNAGYEGTLSEDGTAIIGTWMQGGLTPELNMTRKEA